MKRWAVRIGVPLQNVYSTITVVADRCELTGGVAAFYAEDGLRLELVRAFGVGQWRDIEPLADPPADHLGGVHYITKETA